MTDNDPWKVVHLKKQLSGGRTRSVVRVFRRGLVTFGEAEQHTGGVWKASVGAKPIGYWFSDEEAVEAIKKKMLGR